MTRDVLLPFLLLEISGYFLTTVVAQTCYPDWIRFEESCYGFGEDPVSWGDADDICGDFGARLAEIETEEENNFLKNISRAKQGQFYWVGGTDIFHEGVWRWVSTGELIYSFTDWGPNRPNDVDGQDCLRLDHGLNYQWNDGKCASQWLFICEGSLMEEPIVG